MFCELFNPPAPSAKKKPKKKDPRPAVAEQRPSAPFKTVREKSPEPAPIPALDYEYIEDEDCVEQQQQEEEEYSECNESDAEGYECNSMTMSEEEPGGTYGSVDSSPGMFFERRKVVVEKKRPAGIALSFDDDSWID